MDGALGNLPVPGSASRQSILSAWGQDRCLAAAYCSRVTSKQALNVLRNKYQLLLDDRTVVAEFKERGQCNA